MFDEYTRNGSCVTESTAGIESMANTRSADSIAISATNSGVATRLPSIRVRKRSPSSLGAIGMKREIQLLQRAQVASIQGLRPASPRSVWIAA